MPDKSTMPDAPQLSRRAKLIHTIRRVCSSRLLGHVHKKKRLNHSLSCRQVSSDMTIISGDAPRQHRGSACPSSSSPEDYLTTTMPKTITLENNSVSLKDDIKICTGKDTNVPDITQSSIHDNIIMPRENSATHETNNFLPTKFMNSETHEYYFYNKYIDMATTKLPNWQTNFDFWAEIPHEIALGIFFYLTPKELVRVSIVSRRFHNICFDGQLWTSFDASRFYKEISAESLAKILVSAGPFVKTLNLRGCIQVEHFKRDEVIVKACNNLINTTLEGCRNFQHSTLHSLLIGNIKLVNLNLTGLVAVTNGTCKIIAQTCPRLESLDISGCTHMDARGIRMVVQGCKKLKDLRIREIKGIGCTELAQDIFETNLLERFILSGCTDLTDQALRTMIHGKDPEIDILTDVPLVPVRKLRYLDISRCYRITDFGIRSLAYLTFDLQGLLLSGCSRIGNEGLKDVVTSTPHLTHLDLEELSNLTNDFFNETLAKAPCALTLKHLSISFCDEIGDAGMIPIFRNCINLQNVELDNTDISDIVLSEAANMLQSRRKINTGQISYPIIGLRLVVYDCPNVTWTGIRETLSRNSNIQKSTSDEIPAQITELISLRCYYSWQMTVDEHTKRLVRGDLQAAHRLEKLWADWIISNEETSANGSGTRRRRRRARDTRIIHTTEERGDRNRQRTRVILNTSGCEIM